MKNALIIDSVYPSSTERHDYRNYIDYLIAHRLVHFVFCGNESLAENERVGRTLICRTRGNYQIGNRFAELKLVIFLCVKLITFRKDIDDVFIFYFPGALPVIFLCRLLGIAVTIDFRSVPLENILVGKLLRTLCAFLSNRLSFISDRLSSSLFILPIKKPRFVLPLGINLYETQLALAQKSRSLVLQEQLQLQGCFVYLVVGTIHVTRQLEHVVMAFMRVVPMTTQPKLLIVGGGPHFDKLRQYISQNGNANILLLGPTDHQKVLSLMLISHVGLTYYSKDVYNAQPALKTLEYWSMGLPVIAVDTEGNREYVVNGSNGILVANDVTALAAAMQRVYSDQQFYRDLKNRVASLSLEEYRYESLLPKYLSPIFLEAR